MSEMMVLGFENEMEADRFGLKLAELQKDMIIQLGDAAEVVRDPDGKPHVKSGNHLVGAGAMGGAFWGMLFGLLFFVPFLGLAIGAGMGALFGKMGDTGIKQEFISQVRDVLKPGMAGLVIMYRKATPDKTVEALAPFGGHVLKSSLSADAEAALNEALDGVTAEAPTQA